MIGIKSVSFRFTKIRRHLLNLGVYPPQLWSQFGLFSVGLSSSTLLVWFEKFFNLEKISEYFKKITE